ncbi:MAG: hypothetical protein A2086_13305 [Spirochaetes bacterium GWD1_27_9]|nr:MAG: hypothetical protein A2Z98_15210 [Spirochaetes bacterium GWB1_27_13]OHD27005.1 MAG: hypothetical protein A2Y34_07705 [Spirochaetes bacterium GWC1_27_15]OHD45674.1 MAG: hypothetical protein A2086_13305 [Spirochaetes bacterium GWD1_27_9]
MKKLLLIIFILSNFFIFSQENDFFIRLSEKEIATFNDAITLMRLLYDDKEDTDIFIENVLWAAEKKLFQVRIPIIPTEINPVITRKEFAYWVCKVFDLEGAKENPFLTRTQAYNSCVILGILHQGRGKDDCFTGVELLDTFSYLTYYVRYYKIKPVEGDLEFVSSAYDDLPEWRKIIYKELDEQRMKERKLKQEKIKNNKKKQDSDKIEKDNKKDEKVIKEKFIDDIEGNNL